MEIKFTAMKIAFNAAGPFLILEESMSLSRQLSHVFCNDNLMQLVRYAYYKCFTPDELDNLVVITHAHIGCREYNEKYIHRDICWGYTHSDAQEDLAANRRLYLCIFYFKYTITQQVQPSL